MKVQVLFTGRSYQASGKLPDQLELPEGSLVSEALVNVQTRLSESDQLPQSCLLSVSGQHLGTIAKFKDRPLRGGDELVLIAPVAGG